MSEAPTVTLIGPGAIGAALAAGVIEAGGMPTLVARTTFDRLQVTWPKGEIDVPVSCVTDASRLSPADVVIVATKATHNEAIAAHVHASTKPGSIVVVAQNGIDHELRFPGLGDEVHVVPAVVVLPADRQAPGRVEVGKPSRLVIPAGPHAARVSSVFDGSFIRIEVNDDWLTAAWFKLVLNAPSGGIGVLARRGSDIYADPEVQDLVLALMEEVAAVGRAEGAELAQELPTQILQHHVANAGGHTTSIVVDRLAGAPTEWRERNQVVVDKAAKHGIAVPYSRALTTLMRLGEPSES